MKAFWFCREDGKLRYGDGRSVRVGQTHKVDLPIELCEKGLHASIRLIDALRYAPGPILYLVEMGGKILGDNTKVCTSERKYLASFNAEKLLRHFARRQALINIEKIKPYTDQYDLIVEYLETGAENIMPDARSAALAAARSAARSAAWDAAESAAESAARSAAWDATWDAAWHAAWDAARSAAWDAALAAARSAARSAAWDAAWDAANEMLTQMVREETGWGI